MTHPRHQVLIRFGYRGDRFYGLQPQKDLPTAGGALRARLEGAAGCRAKRLCFAARTDRGVHAMRNAATCFFRDEVFDPGAFFAAMRAPHDDGLWNVQVMPCPISVHARGSSRGKRYRYIVDAHTDAAPDPFAWRIAPDLDVDRMRAAARLLEGEHDYTSFRSRKCTAATPVKRLARIAVRGPYPLDDGQRVFIEVVGNAFLRQMVRNLVGFLVEVGTGWRAPDDTPAVLAALDRRAAGLCAPPGGLCLVDVGFAYPDDGSARIPELGGVD